MNKRITTVLKFYPLLVKKPFVSMRPGAYTGERFEARSMNDMCEIKIESPYVNVNTNTNLNFKTSLNVNPRWKK